MRRHRWSLKRYNKVPANHVASQKLPYPLPGSGRRAGTLACSYTEAPNHVETMHEQIHEHALNELYCSNGEVEREDMGFGCEIDS